MRNPQRTAIASLAFSSRSRTHALALLGVVGWIVGAAGSTRTGIWLGVGGAAVVLGLAIVLLDRAATRALLRPSPSLLLLGAAAGGLMAALTYLLYPLLVRLAPLMQSDAVRLYAAFRLPSLAVASLALPLVVLGEELVWRGVVLQTAMWRFGAFAGVVCAAGIYALAHVPLGSPLLVLLAFACAIPWGALRLATGSLVPTLVAHLIWDALVMVWLPLDAR